MEKYKRIFVIVLDSLGIGEMPDAARFGDHDVDTFGHICDIVGTLNIPNLKKLGIFFVLDLIIYYKPIYCLLLVFYFFNLLTNSTII